MRRRSRLLGGLLAACVAATAAVQSGGARPPERSGAAAKTLTVYSSLPLQGAARPQATAIVKGIRLALADADARAGRFAIRYRSLSDSTRQVGSWTPERVSINARRAARDDSAIAYIGEFNSGGSAIALPILNEAGLFQVSPSNTAPGLTRNGPGTHPGEPGKYYPSGRRTYARVVPQDHVQADALGRLIALRGCRRLFVAHDGEIYGEGLATGVRSSARRRGVRVVGFAYAAPRNTHYRALATRMKRRRADCFAFGGITWNNAVQLFKDVERKLPAAKLFGGDGLAESGFSDPREGGVPERVGRKVRVMVTTLAPSAYPRAGRRFFRRFARRYGERNPDPYAIYGYESMALVLDAIRRAGADGDRRRAVVAAAFRTKRRRSVLGRYSIDRRGDTTLTDYGVYRIQVGRLVFDRRIRP